MSVTPAEIARHIERERRPWWAVWYGRHTGHYWAMALWVPGPAGVLEAPTPHALTGAMESFETTNPKPATSRIQKPPLSGERPPPWNQGRPLHGHGARREAWHWGFRI